MRETNPAPGNLPPKAARMLADVYDERRKAGLSKARASEVAWGAVKKYYHRKRGETRWRKRKTNPAKHRGWTVVVVKATASSRRTGSVKGKWNAVGTPPKKGTTGMVQSYGHDSREDAVKALHREIAKKTRASKPKRRNASPQRSTNRLPTTSLKSAPVRLDDIELAELGSVLEIETDQATIAWPRGKAVLAWSPKAKSLVVVEGGKRTTANTAKRGRARGAYERFADRDASKTATVDVNPRGAWKRVGNVSRIDYHSNKWNRRAEYTHKSGPGVRLYMKGSWDNPPRLWVLKGGRMTVTRRGIVN